MSCKGAFTFILAIALIVLTITLFKGRPPQNHYEALGVTRFATEAEIKTQFRRTALKYHPDKNPDDEAAKQMFHALVDARDTLMDPDKRREYDEKLDNPQSPSQQQQQHHHHHQQQQRPPPPGPPGSWHFRTESWNCQTNTCWWFTYIRDTMWQYMSFWGFINLIFLLGVGTFVIDGVMPKIQWLLMYIVCHCIWNPLTRTQAVVEKERVREEDMREKMRRRYVQKNTDT